MLTCVGLMVLPGPDMALVTRWTLRDGAGGGWRAVGGILTTFAVYSVLLTAGAAAVISSSPAVVTALRVGGGLYLLWLALGAWREAGVEPSEQPDRRGAYMSGVISNAFNPKQTLFLLSLLPQFAPGDGGPTDIALLLAVLWVVSVAFWALWIASISRLRHRVPSAALSRFSAFALAAVGVALLLDIV